MAKETSPDKIQLEVVIDGSPARKELAETRQELVKLKGSMKEYYQKERELIAARDSFKGKDKEAYQQKKMELQALRAEAGKVAAAMELNEEKQNGLRKALGTTGLSANELRGYLARLKTELNSGVFAEGSEAYRTKAKEIQRVEERYKSVNTTIGRALLIWEEERKTIDRTKWSVEQLRMERERAEKIYNSAADGSAQKKQAGKELDAVTAELKRQTTEVGRAEKAWEKQRMSIDRNKWSIEQLGLEQKRLQAIVNTAKGDSPQQRRAAAELEQVTMAIDRQTTAAGRAAAQWEKDRLAIDRVKWSTEQLGLEQKRQQAIYDKAEGGSAAKREAAVELNKITAELKQQTTEAGRSAEAWEKDRLAIDRAKWSTEQLGMEQKRLQNIYNAAEGDSAEKRQAAVELDAVTAELKKQTTEAGRTATAWEKLRGSMRVEDMSIEQLKQEKAYLERLMETTKRTGAEFDKLEQDLLQVDRVLKQNTSETARNEREWERMRKSIKLTELSMEELVREIAFLERAKSRLNPTKDAAAFDVYSRSLKAAQDRQKLLTTGMGPFARMWQEVKVQALSAGAVIGGLFAGGAFISGARNMIRSSAELADAISDVRKTTGLSTAVVKELVTELGKLDTRTSRAELLALARDAGKLGISAKEDVLAFVRAGNQINVALGEDLGEDAIKNIGKLVDLFKLKEQFGLEGAMLKVGSAINELGMSSTASEGYMVDFLKRMGGIAPLAGITVQQTLALGATLDALGQTSEVSSTALSKLFVKLGSDAEKYAGIAGMSVTKFKDVLGKNALEAFIAVLEGSKKTEGGVVALSETLGEMGIDAARAAGVFGALSQNTKLLRTQMELANTAFTEGTSITDEYTEKNENLAAQLEKLYQQFNRLIANNTIIDFLTGLVSSTKNAIDWMERHADMIKFVVKILATAGAAWLSYNVAVAAASTAEKVATAFTRARVVVQGLLTGQIRMSTAAQQAFNTVSKANPWGLIASLITTAIGLYASFGREVDSVTQSVAAQTGELSKLYEQARKTNEGTEVRKRLITEMKALYPEHLAFLNAETASNDDLSKAIKEVNEQLISRIIIQKKEDQIAALREQALQAGVNARELEVKAFEAAEALAKKYKVNIEQLAGSSATTADKIVALQVLTSEKIAAYQKANPGKFSNALDSDQRSLLFYSAQLERLQKYYDDEQALIAQAEKEKQELNDKLLKTSGSKAPPKTSVLDPATEEKNAQAILRSVTWLNEQIAALEKQRNDAPPDPKKYAAYDAQIKALEAERARITGGSEKAAKLRDKTAEDLDKLLGEYKKFQAELLTNSKDEDEKQLSQLRDKHAQELKETIEQQAKLIKAKKLSETDAEIDLTILGGNQAAEEVALLEAQGEARMKVLRENDDKIRGALDDFRNEKLEADVRFYEEEIRLAQDAGKDASDLIRKRSDAELALYAENAKDLIAQEVVKYDELIALAKKRLEEFDKKISESGIEPNEEVLAERQAMANEVIAMEQAQANAISSIRRTQRQEERAARRAESQEIRQEYAKRLQNFALVADATAGLINSITQLQDANIAAAEARADSDGVRTEQEIAEIERLKVARRDAALFAIKVQAAAALANGIASAMTLPFPANLAAAVTTAATLVGLFAQARALMNESTSGQSDSAANAAGIAGGLDAVPYGADGLMGRNGQMITSAEADRTPRLARGGGIGSGVVITHDGEDGQLYRTGPINGATGGGVLRGNLHSAGGNDVVDRKTGKVLANVEKDELMLVMSRRATAANADLIPALMKASRDGTRITPLDRPLALPDPMQVSNSLRVVHMAQGGTLYGQAYQTFGQMGRGAAKAGEGTEDVVSLFNSAARSRTDDGEVVRLLGAILKATERYPRELTATTSIVEGERAKVDYEKILAMSRGRKRA